jgi:hypothetical protein
MWEMEYEKNCGHNSYRIEAWYRMCLIDVKTKDGNEK